MAVVHRRHTWSLVSDSNLDHTERQTLIVNVRPLSYDSHEENTVVTPNVTHVVIIKRILVLGFASELSSVRQGRTR